MLTVSGDKASSSTEYTLIGGDAVIESSGRARVLELNFYPNLVCSDTKEGSQDQRLKLGLLEDVLRLLLHAESADGRWYSGLG